ncbi:MAG: hypoxanthine-guanine phosphoribosyltransferase [Gammaproteobacteria bacterium]|nr:hypoxanthine-guanine phosphoribosyltransferase [Gammaproteobacteria bacterium]
MQNGVTHRQEIGEVLARKSECLFSSEKVEQAVDKMAHAIREKISSEEHPLFLCLMLGGVALMAGLLRRLAFPLEVDYLQTSRYQNNLEGGELKWLVEPSACLKGRTVVLVDDVLDGGVTLGEVVRYCKRQSPHRIYTTVLVEKEKHRSGQGVQHADFIGLTTGDHYLFGYGMDYKGYWRNAPGIYKILNPNS